MKEFSIPREAYQYILFQRTQYLKSPRHPRFYRFAKKLLSFESIVKIESRLFTRQIATNYFDDMCDELKSIREHLPDAPGVILDIGCGIAGIDALLYDHYQGKCDLLLLDKSRLEENVFYQFESKGAFYNSLNLAVEFLTRNGVEADRISTQEATAKNEILFEGRKFNLVLSLISWGYHYPVNTYLNSAYQRLAPGGRLIIDVRKGNDQAKQIEEVFGNVTVIDENAKAERTLAIKTCD